MHGLAHARARACILGRWRGCSDGDVRAIGYEACRSWQHTHIGSTDDLDCEMEFEVFRIECKAFLGKWHFLTVFTP